MNENEEVKRLDADVTLTSSNPEHENELPELNSSAVPTVEQINDADLTHSGCSECENVEQDVVPEMTVEQEAVEKLLSQKQVDEIVGRTRTETRDKTLRNIFNHYEVEDEEGLDNLFAKSQSYDTLKDETDSIISQMKNELGEVKSKIAMYESNIAPERYEDVKLILKGKGLDITAENIMSEMATHPEWKKADPVPAPVADKEVADGNFGKVSEEREAPMPYRPIEVLGNERPETQSGPTEREIAMKMFDL